MYLLDGLTGKNSTPSTWREYRGVARRLQRHRGDRHTQPVYIRHKNGLAENRPAETDAGSTPGRLGRLFLFSENRRLFCAVKWESRPFWAYKSKIYRTV